MEEGEIEDVLGKLESEFDKGKLRSSQDTWLL